MAKFFSGLKVSEEDNKILIDLTPNNYIGLAPKLVELLK